MTVENFCVAAYSAAQKREVSIVWLVTNAHVTQGVPRSERGHSLTMTPDERLLSLHDVQW